MRVFGHLNDIDLERTARIERKILGKKGDTRLETLSYEFLKATNLVQLDVHHRQMLFQQPDANNYIIKYANNMRKITRTRVFLFPILFPVRKVPSTAQTHHTREIASEKVTAVTDLGNLYQNSLYPFSYCRISLQEVASGCFRVVWVDGRVIT